MNLKMNSNESYAEFCNRVMIDYKHYGFATARDCFKELTGIDMFDNARKGRAYAKNINNAIESGYWQKFKGDGELNSFYKSDEMVEVEDKEMLLKSNQQLRKQVQSYQDKLRILRAEHRQEFRKGNSFEELLEGLKNMIPKYNRLPVFYDDNITQNKTAIISFSDCHISKTVDLATNKFNYDIARQRLHKYVNKCKEEIEVRGVDNIYITFLGDITNLDSHGMNMTNEFKRSESLLKAFDLFSELIESVLELNIRVSMCSIMGNESRLHADLPMSNVNSQAKENLDYVLFQMLKRKFSDCITFIGEGDRLEEVMSINSEFDLVMLHGHNLKHNQLQQEVDKIKLRVSKSTGKLPKCTIFGHVHSPLISSDFARSGSIVGEDYYSVNTLNIPHSSVSQNLYIVENDKIIPMIIDCR